MRAIVFSASVVLAGLAAPVVAQEPGGWARFTSPSGRLSVQVPCPAEVVEELAKLPAEVGIGTPTDPANRVSCIDGDSSYLAAIVSFPNATADDARTFDLVRGAVLARDGAQDNARDFLVAGRRAFISREASADRSIDTGFVEVDKDTVVFIVSGASHSASLDANAALDRFVMSIRITSQ